MENKLKKLLYIMQDEYLSASNLFNEFHSYHEGIAVIREEFEELWDLVKQKDPCKERMKKECIQIGAMAIRFYMDLLADEKDHRGLR